MFLIYLPMLWPSFIFYSQFCAGMAALRTGAELVYVFTAEEAALPIKSYSPELMVTPVYSLNLKPAGEMLQSFPLKLWCRVVLWTKVLRA